MANKEDIKKRATHVMFIEHDERHLQPIFFETLKDASDKADEIIKQNPKAECGIYQLRADLKGEINIIRKDYSN